MPKKRLKKPSNLMSAYAFSKDTESPSGSRSSFDSGAKEDGKVMLKSDAPERNNYYEYADPKDAQDAYDSFKAENEMRVGMKKGGKVSSASSRADGCAVKGKTKGRYL